MLMDILRMDSTSIPALLGPRAAMGSGPGSKRAGRVLPTLSDSNA